MVLNTRRLEYRYTCIGILIDKRIVFRVIEIERVHMFQVLVENNLSYLFVRYEYRIC